VAKHILYNASFVINSVDLSDHHVDISFVVGLNDEDAAAMGEVQDYSMPGTQVVSPISVSCYQDFAAAKVYATLMPLYTARSTVNCLMKADAGANATTNPQFTVAVFVKTFPVISGSRGKRHITGVVLQPAGLMAIATS
jgi:hypothetical protein